MSGIILQINHDGSPVNRKSFHNMFSRIEHRGGDSSNHLFVNNTALGCHDFWTTPEDVDETQPAVSVNSKIYLLLDGRIDNRAELIASIGIDNKNANSMGDANLVLKAYQKWQERSFEKLIGSFAIIIYLSEIKKIIAVRDQVGDRTLFYYNDSKNLIVSSEPYSILGNREVPQKLNKNKVAEYLAIKQQTDNSTYFRDIYELLPGHYMCCKEKRVELKNYWNFNVSERIRYRDDNEYAEHLIEILHKSISSKMRAVKPPGIMMSGGLDSTSIAAIASDYSNGRLKTFSYVFDKYKDCDESWYIDEFCKMYDTDSFRLNGDDYLPLVDIKSPCVSPNFPNQDSYQILKNELYRQVEKSGSNTLLTGWYADQLFAGEEFWLKESVRDFQFPVLYKNLKSLVSGKGFTHLRKDSAVRTALRPFRKIKNFIFGQPLHEDKYYYMTPYAKSLMSNGNRWNSKLESQGRPGQVLNVLGLRTAYDASACSHCTTGVNIDFRYPFRDVRLIEYFLKLPAYQLHDDSAYKNKYILRNAMKGLLPTEILDRNKITNFIDLLDQSYSINKKDMNRLIMMHIDEIGEYIENNIVNVIVNKNYNDFQGLESNLYWSLYTYLEWKSRVFK